MQLFDITDKVALVTGSSRGIGKAIAVRMAEAGAKVVISSRHLDACEAVVDEIKVAGGDAYAVACNISDKGQLQQLVDSSIEQYGQIDILVCNAAVNPHYGPSQEIPDDAFEKILHCNIMSNHWLCQMTIPAMAERGDGSVIIISSVAGLHGTTVIGTYGISKAAIENFMQVLADETESNTCVRVNSLDPGPVATSLRSLAYPGEHPQGLNKAEDVVRPYLFLMGPDSKGITGQQFSL
jgi:NAD(P)-dependent dehydrogenase (short-subunit alcohol dehydrogenase family)